MAVVVGALLGQAAGMAAWYDRGPMGWRQVVDMPPLWLLGFLACVWGLARVWPGAGFGALRWPGGLLVLAGLGLMVWAVAGFRAHSTTVVPHQLPRRIITSGAFAVSRNPIYLGDVMVLAGAVLWWGSLPGLVLIPLFAQILQRRFIAPEEMRMKESFGAEFDAYALKTRRWL